jgi:hypothetical protein
MSGGFLCFPDELLNSAVHDAAGGKPRITPFAYMIIRDATPMLIKWLDSPGCVLPKKSASSSGMLPLHESDL